MGAFVITIVVIGVVGFGFLLLLSTVAISGAFVATVLAKFNDTGVDVKTFFDTLSAICLVLVVFGSLLLLPLELLPSVFVLLNLLCAEFVKYLFSGLGAVDSVSDCDPSSDNGVAVRR